MTAFSTAARTAHGIGLATAVAGTLFGRAALRPALQENEDPENRDRISSEAWRRYSWLNLAAHGVFAASWFASRSMSGRRLSGSTRTLTRIKDGLVITSLATGIGRVALRRMDRNCGPEGNGENVISEANRANRRHKALQRAASTVGVANLLANIAIVGITTVLALEGRR
jgi:hypothetical protein